MENTRKDALILILVLLISGFLNFFPADALAATGPISVSLTANPQNINKGEKTTLSWNSTNADFCVAHSNIQGGWFGIRSVSGTEAISPNQTATYLITCSNNGGFAGSAQIKITVGETSTSNVSVNITANPESIFRGESTTLIWSSTNATSCEASGYWSGLKPPFGSESVSPSTTVSYTLRCNNSVGEYTSDTQVIFVNPSGSTPFIPTRLISGFNASCVAEPAKAYSGQSVMFAGAQSYGAEPVTYKWSGDVSGNTQTIKTSFATTGTKTAQLAITDSAGKTVSAVCSVQIVQSTGIAGIFPIFKTTLKTKLPAPTNLKPNGEELPAKTKEVALSWDKVTEAKFYAVRTEPTDGTDERDSRNNCPNNPHYLCVNNLDSTSVKIGVEPGKTYNWWIHSVDANGTFSDAAFAKFSVKVEEAGTGDNFLANIFGGISGIGIFSIILIILAFIIGYLIGKSRKQSLNL